VALVAVGALPAHAHANPGQLDFGFGAGDGILFTNFTRGFDAAYEAVVQSDGKIVVAGEAAGWGGRISLARYNADGTLDSSFGLGDGKLVTNLTRGFDGALEVAVQGDGKIVVAGTASGAGGKFALVRYEPDGSLDSTFGGDGIVTTNFTGGADVAYGLVVLSDGKLIAGGRAGGAGGRFALVRYEPDGSLDSTFGGDGKVTTNFTRGDDDIDTVVIQADGRIVVAGTSNRNGRAPHFALARYNANGSLDQSFGGDGKVTTRFSRTFDGAFALGVQPSDQKLVAAGSAGGKVGLARYRVNGSLDPSFSGDGKLRTDFGPGFEYAEDLVIQSDETIVITGTANWNRRNSKFALGRYDANGSLDQSFGGDGKVTTNLTPGIDWAISVAIQPTEDRLVVAGYASGKGGRFALAGYEMS
jgi:uncharacterized delta-60 repeat protein